MAKSIKSACANVNDELYTPRILVEAIIPELKEKINLIEKKKGSKAIVWLPFDTEYSEFNLVCKEHNLKTICSHITTGQDFFEYEPEEWDIVVSNPPFSRKLEVFKKLNDLGKPWAMVMNMMALNYQEIGYYFADNPIQMLIVDKRVSFNGSQSSFNSSYICGNNFLKKDLTFKHIDNNNANQFYVPSRMYEHIEELKKKK
ncbi:MAG: hypothetical protein ACRC4M_03360 [Mycoplasma sp.]